MTANADDFRIEHDTMGEVRVPKDARWKAQTQRAVENFPISGVPIDPALIAALGRIKGAAARTNAELGVVEPAMAQAITTAAAEVAAGQHDAEFPIDVFQTGSGTSSNMNTNEVISSLASQALGTPVHPNDHVNASQSSNDVFPSAMHIATTDGLITVLIPALRHLEEALSAKAEEFAEVVKSGRTHLMDATPVTLGQEFGGYAAQIRYGVERIEATIPRVAELPLGGTAVGTGINMPAGFAGSVIADHRRRNRTAVHRSPRPLRGPGCPGRPGRGLRCAADHRGQPEQDRQRSALDGVRSARGPGRDRATRSAAGSVRSCRARSIRCWPRRPSRWWRR